MSYRLKTDESACAGLQRVASEQIDKALEDIRGAESDMDEAVHELRKRCKKLRGLLRLYRAPLGDTYPRENACLRDLAASFSGARDSAARLESFEQLMSKCEKEGDRFKAIRAELQRRNDAHTDAGLRERLAEAEQTLCALRNRVDSWQFNGRFRSIAPGLVETYGRGRTAQSALQSLDSEELHELRKRTKYHGYHLKLLEGTWPDAVKAYRESVEKLADLLGEDRDLVLLRQLVSEEPEAFGGQAVVEPFLHLIERRREELQAAARPFVQRSFAEKPGAMRRRMKSYWKASRSGQGRAQPAA